MVKRMSKFELWIRTGRTGAGETPAVEVKFNERHDPQNGQFTFVGQGGILIMRNQEGPAAAYFSGVMEIARRCLRSYTVIQSANRQSKSSLTSAIGNCVTRNLLLQRKFPKQELPGA